MSIILSALALAGCTKESEGTPGDSGQLVPPAATSVPFVINATTSAPESRTAIDAEFNTTWIAEDQISIFHSENGSSDMKDDGAFIYGSESNFSGNITEGLTTGKYYDWYAFYPHCENAATPAQIPVTIPASVTASESGVLHMIGDNAPLYGKLSEVEATQTPSFTMHHLLSVIEAVVHNNTLMPMEVSSVTLEAEDNISGDFSVDICADSPAFTEVSGSKSVTLSLSSPVTIKASQSAKFYFGVKPFTAAKGSVLKLTVNDASKTVTLTDDVAFNSGKIRTLNYNSNGPTFTVNASGKKVVFSVGNLWYGHEASGREFKIAEMPNETVDGNENNWQDNNNGDVFNGKKIMHFNWAPTAAEAYDVNAYTKAYNTTDRIFAADGGAIEGWTVLTKDEWDYLLNKRTVNGGTGAGYAYFISGYKGVAGYKADGTTLRGVFIFPDDYTGTPAIIGTKSLSWETINSAGIAYLPGAGNYSMRRTSANQSYNGWISCGNFGGAYLGADIFVNDSSTNTFCTVKFNQNSETVTINTAPKAEYGYTIRLVKVVE